MTIRIAGSRAKGFWSGALAVLAAAVLLAACGSSSSSSTKTATSKALTKSPLTIGVISDSSGQDAPTVVPQVNGMKAWETVINAEGGLGGHPVNLDICNSESSTTQALICAQQLSSTGIVIDVGTTGEVAAVAKRLQSAGKVVLTPDPTLNPAAGSNIFQTVPSLAAGLDTFLGAAKATGIKLVGLITTDDASGVAISHAVGGVAGHLGLQVTSELIAPTATDATVQVQQLVAAKVGMIYDGVVGSAGTVAIQAAKTLGLKLPIVVNAGDVYPSFLAAAASAISGQIYGAPPSNLAVPSLLSGPDAAAASSFEQEYLKVTGKPLDLVTTNFIGAVQASNAASILFDIGAKPSLSAVSQYLTSNTVGGVIPLAFPSSGPQVVDQTVGLAEAKAGATQWGSCVSSSILTCP